MAELERKQDRSPVPSAFDYAPAPEARDLVRLEERYGLFVGGDWVEPRSGEYHPSVSPLRPPCRRDGSWRYRAKPGIATERTRLSQR